MVIKFTRPMKFGDLSWYWIKVNYRNMENFGIISPLNLLCEPEAYNHDFLQIFHLIRNTAGCQTFNCFSCMQKETYLNCGNSEINLQICNSLPLKSCVWLRSKSLQIIVKKCSYELRYIYIDQGKILVQYDYIVFTNPDQ